jgi:hypothetical protein
VAADSLADAPAVTRVPGVAARIVVEGSALGDAPVAAPSYMLSVVAAQAWAGLPISQVYDSSYRHFRVRGQGRGFATLPEIPEPGTPMEEIEEDSEQTPVEEEQVRRKGGRRRRS